MKRTWEKLHKDGFTIHRGAVSVPNDLTSIKTRADKRAKMIFNHNGSNRNDSRRKQATVPRSAQTRGIYKNIRAFLEEQYPNLDVTNMVILKSLPGCQEQAAHCDYEPTEDMLQASDSEKPCGCLVTLTEGTHICVWPGAINYGGLTKKRKIDLHPGDVLVFRGDLVHAGGAYTEENYRIHTFLDSRRVSRKKNRTYLV